METISNGWTDKIDDMTMQIKTRQRLIEELAEENLTLKRDLGQVRAALKLVAFSIRRHLGIEIL